MSKTLINQFVLVVCAYISVNGQTLPPLETLPTDSSSTGQLSGVNGMNMSSIYSPFDECCLNGANNSLDDPNVVYIGAVALNMDNECQVVCQIQVLQSFSLAIGPFISTRSVIIGNIYTAFMPDNSTCSKTGMCMEGLCNMNMTTVTTPMPKTTMGTNTTTSRPNSMTTGNNSTAPKTNANTNVPKN
ncbi:unnamed protein product [Medioppia subpectinata]|uniref:Uncharacterized protein n=1 Tax=Medioppia subpectinata TaxID=1979941 RepID=A0A7R9Q5Z8_9ACAR|nr:unnamed protein product [Medioppia subpectinata]CAG2114271.1 unnamed protein product [Medioppia subpectinata]